MFLIRRSCRGTVASHGSLNSTPTGPLTASPLPQSSQTCPSSEKSPQALCHVFPFHQRYICYLQSPVNVLCFYCRYNSTGLRFGKVDIGRYGEVSQRSTFSVLPNTTVVLLFLSFHEHVSRMSILAQVWTVWWLLSKQVRRQYVPSD